MKTCFFARKRSMGTSLTSPTSPQRPGCKDFVRIQSNRYSNEWGEGEKSLDEIHGFRHYLGVISLK